MRHPQVRSSSQGRLPSPSSHRTGLVDLTSGSSGHWGRQSAADRNRALPPGTTAAEHRVGSLRTGAGLGLCSAAPQNGLGVPVPALLPQLSPTELQLNGVRLWGGDGLDVPRLPMLPDRVQAQVRKVAVGQAPVDSRQAGHCPP